MRVNRNGSTTVSSKVRYKSDIFGERPIESVVIPEDLAHVHEVLHDHHHPMLHLTNSAHVCRGQFVYQKKISGAVDSQVYMSLMP